MLYVPPYAFGFDTNGSRGFHVLIKRQQKGSLAILRCLLVLQLATQASLRQPMGKAIFFGRWLCRYDFFLLFALKSNRFCHVWSNNPMLHICIIQCYTSVTSSSKWTCIQILFRDRASRGFQLCTSFSTVTLLESCAMY